MGTTRAPSAPPARLPLPPTISAVRNRNVSGYSQLEGPHAVTYSTSSPPLRPASAPPAISAVIRSAYGFRPSAETALSLSRTARSRRPKGEREIPRATHHALSLIHISEPT